MSQQCSGYEDTLSGESGAGWSGGHWRLYRDDWRCVWNGAVGHKPSTFSVSLDRHGRLQKNEKKKHIIPKWWVCFECKKTFFFVWSLTYNRALVVLVLHPTAGFCKENIWFFNNKILEFSVYCHLFWLGGWGVLVPSCCCIFNPSWASVWRSSRYFGLVDSMNTFSWSNRGAEFSLSFRFDWALRKDKRRRRDQSCPN